MYSFNILAIWECKLKSTMRYYHTSVRMANIYKAENNKWYSRCEITETLMLCHWKCKMVYYPSWQSLAFSKEVDPIFTIQLANPIARNIPKKTLKNLCLHKSYMWMFINNFIHNCPKPGNCYPVNGWTICGISKQWNTTG